MWRIRVIKSGLWVEDNDRQPCEYPTKRAAIEDMDEWCSPDTKKNYEVVQMAKGKDISLPQWKEARKKRRLTTSASQFEQHARCRRQWWFQRVRKLKAPGTHAQTFGDVLHAVAERYLLADDNGRGPDGKPVDLYPPGWHIAKDRFSGKESGEVSPAEQAQIKKLIAKAIEEGILVRKPGRMIERKIDEEFLKINGISVRMFGFIDLEHPGEIVDHKTTKSRRWMKSPQALRENIQVLIYAMMHIRALENEGIPVPATINLVHIYYCKDPDDPVVRKVEVAVPVEEIREHWEQIKEAAKDMVFLRANIENGLSEIGDPENPAEACNAFGGCQYRSICSGRETVEKYERRLDGHVVPADNTRDRPAMFAGKASKKESVMSFASKIAAKAGKGKGGASASKKGGAVAAPKIEKSTTKSKAKEPEGDLSPPPWAVEGCFACKGAGFNKKGKACRICNTKREKSGEPTSDDFEIEPQGDGTVAWVSKEDPDICGVSPLPGMEAEASGEEREEAPSSKAEAEPESGEEEPEGDEATEEPSDDDEGGAEASEEEGEASKAAPAIVNGSPSKGGRPKKGFIFCINCAPTKIGNHKQGTGRYVYRLHDVLAELTGEQWEEEYGKAFYETNAFERRDVLRQCGEALADRFQTDIVVAEGLSNGESDLKALADAIRPFAGVVIASQPA